MYIVFITCYLIAVVYLFIFRYAFRWRESVHNIITASFSLKDPYVHIHMLKINNIFTRSFSVNK